MIIYKIWLHLCFGICYILTVFVDNYGYNITMLKRIYQQIFIHFVGYYLVYSQMSIPETLKECYVNRTTDEILLPLNVRTLVDILRKVENVAFTTMDMRTFSSSLLRRFKFDGIEYIKGMHGTGVLPFVGSGTQRIKHRLIEELVPGNADTFPAEALSQLERCTLHFAISNTINKYESENANIMCQQIGNREKITGRTVSINAMNCTREYGVIFTPYGTISPGSVIGAVAASLQHQNVILKQLLTSSDPESINNNEEDVDLIIPKNQMIIQKSMWLQSVNMSSMSVDNIWLTTIAGDLAEVVVYQGPIVEDNMIIGVTGFWNSTIYPNIYYLTRNPDNYDATRAEIIGDIDGLILASNLKIWTDSFHSLRLSQIFDMYYSDYEINFNTNIKACKRKTAFQQVASKTILTEQTHAVSYLLAYRNSIAHISNEALKRLVNYAVDTFANYMEQHLFTEPHCNYRNFPLQAEVTIAFDGAWTREYTMDFISVLLEDLDVSMYGSKMGILHGTTGEWLLNVTNSPSLAYHAIRNLTGVSWPRQLNYTKMLQTIFTYLNTTSQQNQKDHMIGNLGQVIILLVPLTYMTTGQQQSALSLLQEIKIYYPDVHFLYYTSEYNAYLFKPFIMSEEDHLVKSLKIDDIIGNLSTVSRLLRPLSDINTNNENHKNQMEDYVHPLEFILYRLHARWRKNTKKIIVTFRTVGYGGIKVCSWIQYNITGEKYNEYCKNANGHNDITFTDYTLCSERKICPHIYYYVHNATSLHKCAEMGCRTPDHVRFIIRIESTYYKNCANRHILALTVLPIIFFLSMIFN